MRAGSSAILHRSLVEVRGSSSARRSGRCARTRPRTVRDRRPTASPAVRRGSARAHGAGGGPARAGAWSVRPLYRGTRRRRSRAVGPVRRVRSPPRRGRAPHSGSARWRARRPGAYGGAGGGWPAYRRLAPVRLASRVANPKVIESLRHPRRSASSLGGPVSRSRPFGSTPIAESWRRRIAARPATASTASTPSHAWTSYGPCASWDWTFPRSARSWTASSRFPRSQRRTPKHWQCRSASWPAARGADGGGRARVHT